MDRRQFVKLGGAIGGIVAAGGVGFVLWARQRASAWATEVEAIRRPIVSTQTGADAYRELVRFATLAANSHNTQPWRFAIDADSITIAPDLARRAEIVDPDDHHLFASLGCAAENIVQAAPLLGFIATPRFDPTETGRVVIAMGPGEVGSSALAEAIVRRQCTRAVYDGRAVPAEHLRDLKAAGNGGGISMKLVTERAAMDEILAFIVDGNTRQIEDPAFLAELKRWIRFSYGSALATRDGLFAASSGNPVLPDPVGNILIDLVFTVGVENAKVTEQLRSSAGVAIFASEADDKAHWVEAGRAYQRFALTATALGIRHAFLNQPVEVPAVRRAFADYLGLTGGRPDLVVRFGYGAELPMSLRRPVDDVLV